ncbi:hypothetical protein [Microbulbifer sp. 2205BS26-8]|uniref:hypothetical protein n=1 Tax=Microbulbifer sp. 2205BS26-8 TaxID=3064386 RepID=UPI00273D9186|nr:hypothetical protein [Microbulbifer sp. 2205BS26-8]MDP5211036.1 hypothetical protein [Microbulbifer sp. 2205BS26-8]
MANRNSQPVFNKHDDHILWVTQQQLLHYYDNGDGLFLKNSDTGETVCFLHEDEQSLGATLEEAAFADRVTEVREMLDFLAIVVSGEDYLTLSPAARNSLSKLFGDLQSKLTTDQS